MVIIKVVVKSTIIIMTVKCHDQEGEDEEEEEEQSLDDEDAGRDVLETGKCGATMS